MLEDSKIKAIKTSNNDLMDTIAKIREIVSNKHPLSNMREIQKDIGIFLRELGILNKPRSRKNILEKGEKL